jgi:hypothetical protein
VVRNGKTGLCKPPDTLGDGATLPPV